MAHIEFGHTWWGQRWLDALTNIDYDNRLPRENATLETARFRGFLPQARK